MTSHDRAACLLKQAGFHEPFTLVAVHGGANGKSFRIERSSGAAPLFFKEYYLHEHDPRDRLGTEFSFATFAWQQNVRTIARPYLMDRDLNCALYGYLQATKLSSQEIDGGQVQQCLNFFAAINAAKRGPQAMALPNASEACFSLQQHWDCLRRRIARLEAMVPQTGLDNEAVHFVQGMLVPAASAYLTWAAHRVARLGVDPVKTIAETDRCLSPSDFGFHNVLQAEGGTLNFVDFEYAGWDDPAKTVCDFFCQPAYPVPASFYAEVAQSIAATTENPRQTQQRFTLLQPMYRLKWCCIMLNDFLPVGAGRRRFAMDGVDEASRKSLQLHKARAAFEHIGTRSAA